MSDISGISLNDLHYRMQILKFNYQKNILFDIRNKIVHYISGEEYNITHDFLESNNLNNRKQLIERG